MPTKRCYVCKEVKILDVFHRDTKSTDGRQSKCKSCVTEYAKKKWAERKEKEGIPDQTAPRPYRSKTFKADDGIWMKPCSNCKEILPETEFQRHSSNGGLLKDGVTPAFLPRCQVCEAVYQWEYYRKGDNPVKKSQYVKKHNDELRRIFFENLHGPPIPEEIKEQLTEMKKRHDQQKRRESYLKKKAENPDAWRAADRARQKKFDERNPGYRRRYHTEYRKTPRGRTLWKSYMRKREATRRARQAGFKIDGHHTEDQWQELLKVCEYRCACCGRHQSEAPLTRDHVIPLSKGGSDEIWNMQPLCRNCNSMKHAEDDRFIPPYEELMRDTS